MNKSSRLQNLDDDNLMTPDVGAWAEQKYRLVRNYAQMFMTGMHGKWGALYYVDLFAGTGRARMEIDGESRIVLGSPLIAVEIEPHFDHFIFCDVEDEKIAALQKRVERTHPEIHATYLVGDSNQQASHIAASIPRRSALTLCMVDPYKMGALNFDTIRQLAELRIDFMVLIPTFMDIHRNEWAYTREENEALDHFLGTDEWRKDMDELRIGGQRKFGVYIADYFGRQMKRLGYIYEGTEQYVSIWHRSMNRILYHIAVFSRDSTGIKFAKEAEKYSSDQRPLFE